MTTESKLDYIMKSLGILGTDAAAYLSIDATTVSKWRNNQRRIPLKNGQARRLSEYILLKEKEQDSQIVFNILKMLKSDINPESAEQQIETLSHWLTEKNIKFSDGENAPLTSFSPKNGYNACVSIFLGETGIDEALEYYFEYALRLSPGKTIFLVDNSGINWSSGDELTEKQLRINACMRFFRAVSQYGHRLIIIDCATDIYRPYRAIFRWMELYLLDGVEVWNCPPVKDDSYYYTDFVVENEIALQCISISNPNTRPNTSGKPHGMLFTNKETVDFFSNTVQGIMKKAKRLIESVPSKDVLTFSEITRKSLKPNRNVYVLNPSITLQLIDIDLLREILSVNDVRKDKIEECITAAKRIRRMQTTNQYSYVCNLDVLESFTTVEYVDDSNLAEICEAPIILSKEFQQKVVESVINSDAYKSNRIIFTSFNYLSSVPDNLSIVVQEDSFLAAWNVKKHQKRLYCLSLDVISGFYRYVDDLKTVIPKVCFGKEWKDTQLRRIRDTL
ncbi:MAG: hypothetical protein LBT44_00625 [Clostridiales bacterium]|jgi:hypothetical protein|nr:hypothetical protein [Clostridiales bacterium]